MCKHERPRWLNVTIQETPLNVGLPPIGLVPLGTVEHQRIKVADAGLASPGSANNSDVPSKDDLDKVQAQPRD